MHAVVQLRGEVNMRGSVRDTLGMLNVHGVNHATLVPDTDTYRGMLVKVNDYVAYGEPSEETVATLVRRRAEPLKGDDAVDGATTAASPERAGGSVDDEWIAEHTEYDDVDALAAALVAEETTLREVGLSPVLRLHPPRGGHRGIKHSDTEGGELGKHTSDAMDDLLTAMR